MHRLTLTLKWKVVFFYDFPHILKVPFKTSTRGSHIPLDVWVHLKMISPDCSAVNCCFILLHV